MGREGAALCRAGVRARADRLRIYRPLVGPGEPSARYAGERRERRAFGAQSGRFVAFDSAAKNFVAGDTNGVSDVFVRDHVAAITERVSVSSGEAQANGPSRHAAISDDATYRAVVADTASATIVATIASGTLSHPSAN